MPNTVRGNIPYSDDSIIATVQSITDSIIAITNAFALLSELNAHIAAAAPHVGHATSGQLTAHAAASPLDHPDGSVTEAKIANLAVATAALQNASVTLAKMAASSVGTAQLVNDSVTAEKIAAGAVGSSEIADGSVGTAELADDSVTAAKIAASQVGSSELSNASVTTDKIADGALAATVGGRGKMADAFITTVKIADSQVTTDKLADGALAATTVGRGKMADGFLTTAKIADAQVSTAKIADDAVTAAKIAAGAVGASEIADGAVGTAELGAGVVTLVKLHAEVFAAMGGTVAPLSLSTLEPRVCPFADYINTGWAGLQGGVASAWSSARSAAPNVAVFIPIIVPEDVTVRKITLLNGGNRAGTVDVGIYDEAFNRLVSSGPIAPPGVNGGIGEYNIADTLITKGRKYLAYVASSSDMTFYHPTVASALTSHAATMLGLMTQGAASPLPAVAAPTESDQAALVPVISAILRA